MSSRRENRGADVLRSYTWYGALAGAFVGGLIGVSVAGPHFFDWSPWKSVLTILGCTMVLALSGYVAVSLALGSLVHGSADDAVSDSNTVLSGGSNGVDEGGGIGGGD